MRAVRHFEVRQNRQIAALTWQLSLVGDSSDLVRPGQFVNVEIPGYYLRRPFSVYDWKPGKLELIYKELGQGSEALTSVKAGDTLSVLSGLGNGFTVSPAERPLLVGGGVGVVPLYALCRDLVKDGQQPTVILGFGSADEVYLAEELAALGASVTITTVDGSLGVPGFVTDALTQVGDYDRVYACGPTAMLGALSERVSVPTQFSLEERMACGFGACVGCVVHTRSGMSRVCKEGPVFTGEELDW